VTQFTWQKSAGKRSCIFNLSNWTQKHRNAFL
jgi:hypothetical protein